MKRRKLKSALRLKIARRRENAPDLRLTSRTTKFPTRSSLFQIERDRHRLSSRGSVRASGRVSLLEMCKESRSVAEGDPNGSSAAGDVLSCLLRL